MKKQIEPDAPAPEETVEERRAPDQDAAIEETFETGVALDTLPEQDRRAAEKSSLPDVPLVEPVAESPAEPVAAEAESTEAPLDPALLIGRAHDIIDHLIKHIDPAERLMVRELRQLLTDLGFPPRQ